MGYVKKIILGYGIVQFVFINLFIKFVFMGLCGNFINGKDDS